MVSEEGTPTKRKMERYKFKKKLKKNYLSEYLKKESFLGNTHIKKVFFKQPSKKLFFIKGKNLGVGGGGYPYFSGSVNKKTRFFMSVFNRL